MRLRTVLLLGMGIAGVAILAGVVVLSRMDFGKYKILIVDQAERTTGRKVTIAGDLRLSVFPVPTLRVKDVSLDNAGWGSRPELARLGELSARLELLPLVFGDHVHVARLVLKDLDLLELTPRPKESSLINLAMPIGIAGTFKHPTVQPNKAALAKQVAVGVASTVNPLILIAALVLDKTGSSDKNPCLAALDGGKASAVKADGGGVSGAVKDLGQSIRNIFT